MKSVYIHIPFCKYICSYCDFAKRYIKNQDVLGYLFALDYEISTYIKQPIMLTSLYIGGGTPSSLSIEQLIILKSIIKKYFIFEDNHEFTFELNPDDITDDILLILQQMGVNRISIGMQTLNNEILQNVRREHNKDDCETALKRVKNYFDNVSIDLIFNLPKQTINDIKESLDFIKTYKSIIKNISYYGLIIEEGAILSNQSYDILNEDEEEKIYYYIISHLEKLGYIQYETSNFAQDGYASKHNLVYWNNQNYYGFGLGASGYIGNKRYTNVSSMPDYLHLDNKIGNEELLTNEDMLYEKIMLGLRKTAGIDYKCVKHLIIDEQYFECVEDKIRIKKDKFFMANEAIISLLEQLGE